MIKSSTDLASTKEAKRLNAFIRLINATPDTLDGPLSSFRISVKDNIALDGVPTTGATPAFENLVLEENLAIKQLRAAGAQFTAKTNLHELAFGITGANLHTGPALNPFDNQRLAGGSSSGAAISVAVGAAKVALGTDTGGSCRVPAAHCGVLGFRPTTGRYPSGGFIGLSPSRDTLGVIAGCVADIKSVDAIISQVTDSDSYESITLSNITIGAVNPESFGMGGDPKVLEAYNKMLDDLRRQGVTLKNVDLTEAIATDHSCGFAIAVYETAESLKNMVFEHLDIAFEDFVAQIKSDDVRLMISSQIGPDAIPESVYHTALNDDLPKLKKAFTEVFTNNGVDALIYPTCLFLAPPVDIDETLLIGDIELPVFPAYSATTRPDSMSGQPSISLPYGLVEGLPVGLQLVAPRGEDDQLLTLAALIEKLLPPRPTFNRRTTEI